ncbi:protein kinase family protein [Saccharothrix coeruleofusca]|uniref:Protein kinase domain-containing protein n=1 Tax=Saccharothrix coeruleofusca TaxID=33919 RepID=A0A918EHM5_9PSEU|nr:protein kinase family protein [Saccharothrix coeruleofusca]MBP2335433.1 hypothetical protein [Saccharothrix coeruleofusca]GGP77748.1 hypothetical protein GCM10010185_59480 [Saccharothrix coeruleofusca]
MLTRDEALARVEGAGSATDLFGPRSADPGRRKEARRWYRALAVALHPDRVGPADRRAHAASAQLTRLHHEWRRTEELRADSGARYRLGPRHAVGGIADVHLTDDARHVVKLVRDPRLNPLLHAEHQALRALRDFTAEHRWLAPYYPRMVDAATAGRAFTVFEPLVDGFVTLADVRRAYPDGLDGRDYAWMHRRLLRAVAGAHRIGLVHGAIVPENVLVHPAQHGIVLVGWSFSVERGQRLLATSKAADFQAAYPAEVHNGQPVGPATDIHMAHAVMLTVLAHDEKRQRAFARGCMAADPAGRPDAVDLLDEYDALLEELYGERKFRPFTMNGA